MLHLFVSTAGIIPQSCSSTKPSVAKLFTYEDFGSYQRVNSTQCKKSYILYPRGGKAPALGSTYQYFGTPLQKVAVTQTVTNTFLELLDVRDKMAITSKYSTSACIAKKVADGSSMAFISHSSDAAQHATQMSDSSLDAIFSDPWYTSSWKHAASASKVICEASTYELDPLGSAEWIKFFGYLFGKSADAKAAYCGTRSRYKCNSIVADNRNADLYSYKVPKALFASKDYKGDFSLQMPPYKSKFVKDAGGVYPDLSKFESFKAMHWTGTQLSAFKFPAANISQFHAALQLADVIIDETYPHGQTLAKVIDAYALPGVTVGQTFMTGSDDPAVGSAGWALVSHGVGEKLFTVDHQGKVVGLLAKSVTKNADGTWTLSLQSGRHFSDGSPLTAADVKASLERTNKANYAAQSSIGTMTMTVQDSTTVKISSTIATPVMASVLAEWAFVVYKTNSTGGRVFTGPYAIKSMKTGLLDLIPNAHYPSANLRVPITIKKMSSGGAVVAALKTGEIDMGFNLPSNAVAQLNWGKDVTVKSFPVGYQYMMFFNTKRATLSDNKVRSALALAIDRQALGAAVAPPGMSASAVTDSIATGAFPGKTPWGSVHPPLPTNTTAAARMLDEAGWTLNSADGFRYKGSTQLTLDLVYYTFRSDLVTMAPLIEAQLKAVGCNAKARINDNGDYMDGISFDLLMWAQHTLPAGDPNWFFETFFKTGPVISGSWKAQNFAQLSSTTIDSALAALGSAAPGAARAAAAAAAHRAIIAEAPATFLVSPTWHVGLGSRMVGYEPWGSDYHVIKRTMPKSDWPPAITSGRVYTLDGTMDSKGPPKGGTDWYESRVAEPDAFLADLIAVLHRGAPRALQFLRLANNTAGIKSVAASECTNVAALRPIRAATCASLVAKATDQRLVARLNDETVATRLVPPPSPPPPSQSPSPPPSQSPSPPPSQSPSPPPSPQTAPKTGSALKQDEKTTDNTTLYVAIGVLAGITALTCLLLVYVKMSPKKIPTTKAGGDGVDMDKVATSTSAN